MWTSSLKQLPCLAALCKVLAAGAFSLACLRGQTASDKTSAPAAPAPTFAIETEMLTYRALESNSEAIACDIAAYLNNVTADFSKPPAGTVCDVKAALPRGQVVLLPFDSGELANFQIWRADMANLDRLARKAQLDCPSLITRGGASPADSALSTLLSMSPAGPPLALAQSVLALMASEESVSPLGGNVQDQALMNGVARELRALGVPVLMPSAYTPFSLEPLVHEDSPFLTALEKVLGLRECLSGITPKTDRITHTISDIDDLIAVLSGTVAQAQKNSQNAPEQPVGVGTKQEKPGESKPATNQSPFPATAIPASQSHLNAVLSADGLAQKMGVDPDEVKLRPGSLALHVLIVKALESGGTASRHSNILGGKITYSGGAVGTYALFTSSGDLECSGNVYNYAGSISSKEFRKDYRLYDPEPGKQMIFRRGGCRAARR